MKPAQQIICLLYFILLSNISFSTQTALELDSKQLLFYAAASDDLSKLFHALDAGADPSHINKNKDNALHIAARNNNVASIKVLLTYSMNKSHDLTEEDLKPLINKKGSHGETLLHHIASHGNIGLMRWLFSTFDPEVDIQDDFGETALFKAVQGQHDACVNFLVIEKMAAVEFRNKQGWTAAHWAYWLNYQENKDYQYLSTGTVTADRINRTLNTFKENIINLIKSRKSFERGLALKALNLKAQNQKPYQISKELVEALIISLDSRDIYLKELSLKAIKTLLSQSSNFTPLLKQSLILKVFSLISNDDQKIQKLVCEIMEEFLTEQNDIEQFKTQIKEIISLISVFNNEDQELAESAMRIFNQLISDSHISEIIENNIKTLKKPEPILINLLRNSHFKVQAASAQTLTEIAKRNINNRRNLCRLGIIFPILHLFKSPCDHVRKAAMETFESIGLDIIKNFLCQNDLTQLKADFQNDMSITALHQATAQNFVDIVSFFSLLEVNLMRPKSCDLDEETVLHKAVEKRRATIVNVILQNPSVQVNQQDTNGSTPLHDACRKGFSTAATQLIRRGAIVDLPDNQGRTALHIAALHHNYNCMAILLAADANIDAQDNEGWTPLHLVVKHCFTHVDCAEILLEHEADTTLTNKEGRTACYWIDHGGLDKKSALYLKRNKLRKIFSGLPRTKIQRVAYLKKKRAESPDPFDSDSD